MKHVSSTSGVLDQFSADGAACPPTRRRRWWKPLIAFLLLICLALALGTEYLLHNAEPILRRRIIETLSARFGAPVQLDHLSISLLKGIEVEGAGLRVAAVASPGLSGPAYPILAVRSFSFHTGLRSLLRQPTHVALVRVSGLELHLPPPSQRARWLRALQGLQPTDPSDVSDPQHSRKIAILIDDLRCEAVNLFIESDPPDPNTRPKPPLSLHIAYINLESVGPHQPMRFDAELTNPKPTGTLHLTGHLGPWASVAHTRSTAFDPGPTSSPTLMTTPLDGTYNLQHADLGTIHGLGGTLSSAGHFTGVLDRLIVDGHTDTPNFSLQTASAPRSNHALPLRTDFHAIVDGTTGNTDLQPVRARLGDSAILASGHITKLRGQGHDIDLQVTIPNGRMQDLLRLATRTDPPLLNGDLTLQARLHLAPNPVSSPAPHSASGAASVADRLAMTGSFHLAHVRFNNPNTQARIDALSLRAQGRADDLTGNTALPTTASVELSANFSLGHGVMEISDLHYSLPGALVLLKGVYSLDGRLFEFKGRVRTDATASAMVGGWRGLLLQPVDRFLSKNGAGIELPIEISGIGNDLHFGLASAGKSDTPQGMLADVRDRQRSTQELSAAQRESAAADADDLAAAHASTLAEAESFHAAAVHHRAAALLNAQTANRPPKPSPTAIRNQTRRTEKHALNRATLKPNPRPRRAQKDANRARLIT